jgi:prepilin-type N-terminal cleavage/methylation domain-containing protein
MNSRRQKARRSDQRGMTLIEVLIVLVVMGVLFSAVLTALTFTTRQVKRSTESITISNDTQFVLTYINRDLASATKTSIKPDDQPLDSSVLAGTNVLQASWSRNVGSGATAAEQRTLVSYRYTLIGDVWSLERREYSAASKSAPLTLVRTQTLATSLAKPPVGWVDGAVAPMHALQLDVTEIASGAGRSSVDLTMTMSNGAKISGGGSNGASGPVPVRPATEVWVDSNATYGRCAGRIALILDTSGSVPQFGGGYQLEQAAAGFIDGLADMSMTMTVIGFDRSAYQMYPGTASAFGTYFSLNDAAAREAAKTRITALDDQDGAYDFRDYPTTDGIHWQQTAVPYVDPNDGQTYYYQGGTNWEDGLWSVYHNGSGSELSGSQLPTLAVFVTDGQPNQIRPAAAGGVSADVATAKAQAVAQTLEDKGVKVIGVGVGSAFTTNPRALPDLTTTVGPVVWDGGSPGNANSADVFTGSFSQLGQIMNTITSSLCVSGAALRPVKADGTPATGKWEFSTESSYGVSDPAVDPIVQFNFPMVGTPRRWVDVWTVGPVSTKGVASVQCKSNGVVLGADRVELYAGGAPNEASIRLNVGVNESMSCTVKEKP